MKMMGAAVENLKAARRLTSGNLGERRLLSRQIRALGVTHSVDSEELCSTPLPHLGSQAQSASFVLRLSLLAGSANAGAYSRAIGMALLLAAAALWRYGGFIAGQL